MTKSEMRAELKIWANRKSKKTNAIPIIKNGSLTQIDRFIEDIREDFKKVKLDIDADFQNIRRGAKRND